MPVNESTKAETTKTTATTPVQRLSCSSAPSRPRYADSTRPPIDPVRPSCFVVWIASRKIRSSAARTKMPAMPCVNHGMCAENQVVGAACGTTGGTALTGGEPGGKAEDAADGTTFVAAVPTNRSGFMAASSLRPQAPSGLLRSVRGGRRRQAGRSAPCDRSHQATADLARSRAQPLDHLQSLSNGARALHYPRAYRRQGHARLLEAPLPLDVLHVDRPDALRILALRDRSHLRSGDVRARRARAGILGIRHLLRSRCRGALDRARSALDGRRHARLSRFDARGAVHHPLLEDQHARDRHYRAA